MRVLRVLGLTFFCILFSSAAFADVIPVNNPSFETLPSGAPPLAVQGCGTGCSWDYGPISGWTVSGSGKAGQFQPGSAGYFNSLPDGPTVAFIDDGSISQTLGATVQAGETYTLEFDLGNRTDFSPSGQGYLVVGGTKILATGVTPPEGGWSTYTATFTCDGTCSEIGDSIGILFTSSASLRQGDFDNVRVSAPEPSTLLMLVLGLVGLAAFGWRSKYAPSAVN